MAASEVPRDIRSWAIPMVDTGASQRLYYKAKRRSNAYNCKFLLYNDNSKILLLKSSRKSSQSFYMWAIFTPTGCNIAARDLLAHKQYNLWWQLRISRSVRSRQLIIFQPKIYEAINWNYIWKSRCCFEDKECEIYNMDYEDDTNSNNTTNNKEPIWRRARCF